MDFFPLYNSVRISAISTAIVFFLGVFAANLTTKSNKITKAVCDLIFTLPLVLPPTVVGYLLIRVFGPNRLIGSFLLKHFDVRLTMTWQASVIATCVIIFPLMYRTARGAFESFDKTLQDRARCLGLGENYIFWKIKMPICKSSILSGTVLSFARALGEYGATNMISGYTPQKTATISTTVYQMWRTDNDEMALKWVLVNICISFAALFCLNMIQSNSKRS